MAVWCLLPPGPADGGSLRADCMCTAPGLCLFLLNCFSHHCHWCPLSKEVLEVLAVNRGALKNAYVPSLLLFPSFLYIHAFAVLLRITPVPINHSQDLSQALLWENSHNGPTWQVEVCEGLFTAGCRLNPSPPRPSKSPRGIWGSPWPLSD